MNRAAPSRSGLFLVASVALATGCPPDNNLGSFSFQHVTVTAGDFDEIGLPLDRQGVPYEVADGIISTATWNPDLNHDALALKVEDLFGLSGELGANQAVLVASGTRGLGKRQYNGLDPDDQLVSDPTIVGNVRDYVDAGGVLVVSDWAYDLVEAAWPDAVEFVGDDAEYDDAQRGYAGEVDALVASDDLATALESDQVAIHFDYSNWAVIESVGDDAEVLLTADVTFRPPDDDTGTPGDPRPAPLMVAIAPRGAQGKVVLTSFHLDAQNPPMIDALLEATVGHFEAPPPTSVVVE